MTDDRDAALRALASRRWKVALTLTAVMVVMYFGFIALIAFDKPVLGHLIAPGLSLGVLLGALVIVVSWVYVRWANTRYDAELHRLKE